MSTVIFEHSDRAGSARLGEALRNHGHALRVIQLHRGGQVPSGLDDVDGVVSLGGSQSVCGVQDLPWLEAEQAFLRTAHEASLPVLGICLGSQILAEALSGTVGRMESGPEIGWHEIALSPIGCEDVLHAGIAWRSWQPQWHHDEVQELPAGARLLASSSRCPNQTWAVGLRTYGIQYHPEIREDALARWAVDEPAALEEAGLGFEQLQQQTRQHFPDCARLADRLFESMALLLMPIDRRYSGIAKALHH